MTTTIEPSKNSFGNFVTFLGYLANAIDDCHFAPAVRIRTTKHIQSDPAQRKINASSSSLELKDRLGDSGLFFEPGDRTKRITQLTKWPTSTVSVKVVFRGGPARISTF